MKDRTTAGILAIFLGGFGVHWFYLEQKDKATKYLLISLLTFGVGAMVIGVLSIIDAVHFFGMTDEAFQAEYCGGSDVQSGNTKISVATETKSSTSKYDELKQAKELLDQGVITDEEFADIKRKIL